MLSLKRLLIIPYLCHKSTTTYQTDSNDVAYSTLKSDLCNCVETETIKAIAAPQQQHNGALLSWETLERLTNFQNLLIDAAGRR